MEVIERKRAGKLQYEETRRIVNEIISAGESLPSIGRTVGVTSEGISQYIDRTGQYDNWKENRRSYKQRLQAERQNLANALLARLYSMTEQEGGWEYAKAIEDDRKKR